MELGWHHGSWIKLEKVAIAGCGFQNWLDGNAVSTGVRTLVRLVDKAFSNQETDGCSLKTIFAPVPFELVLFRFIYQNMNLALACSLLCLLVGSTEGFNPQTNARYVNIHRFFVN